MIGTHLLSRDQFRTMVMARHNGRCCVCKQPATASHHIVERRLWTDGGYYFWNGAAVCDPCHLKAESTEISCDQLRQLCNIPEVILPEQLEGDVDKWGNPILPNGLRLRGELFYDESVQKVIAPVLHLFTNRAKYHRTNHLPHSPGKTSDDKTMTDPDACFGGKEVVASVKMDGENTTFYKDYVHARSLDYSPHPSRERIKAIHARIAHDIPESFRICGENLTAKHSIHYEDLEDYFLVFNIWDGHTCLSWTDTRMWTELLGLKTVPVLFVGQWEDWAKRSRMHESFFAHTHNHEGYVVRLADSFTYGQFKNSVAKYVRKDHVQSGDHWLNQQMVENKLKKGS